MEDSPPAPLSVPERRLTPADVEAVIARAIELHLREAAESGDEGIPEAARASGLVASTARAARRLRGRHPLLRADRVEVAVQALDGDSCCVAVAIDLTRKRTEHAGAGLAGGAVAGGGPAAAAGLLVAPPAALVGLPLALGALLAARAAYRSALREAGSRLESVLDRLEHGELAGPAAAGPRLFGL